MEAADLARRDLFKKNLEALKTKDPGLAQRIDAFAKGPSGCQMNRSQDGGPVLIVKSNGMELPLESLRSPREEAVAYLATKKKDLKNPRIAIFLGLGTGYLLEAFLKDRPTHNHLVYVIEPDLTILCANMFLSDMTFLFTTPWIKFIAGLSPEELYPRIYEEFNQYVPYVRTIALLEHPVEYNVAKDYFQRCTRIVRDAAREVLTRYGNSPEDSLRGIVNMLDNVQNIIRYPGVKALEGRFAGKPAVIVAAGPSLEKNVDLLRDVQDKAVIIACDVMLKGLLKRGIKPHFLVSVERIPDLYHLFENVPAEEVEDTWLCACPVIFANNFDVYQGPKVIGYRNFSHFKWLNVEKGILDSGPSVIFLGTKLAELMKCDPIILIGQDLAYGREASTHTDLTTYVNEDARGQLAPNQMGAFEVAANDGGTVPTNLIWYSMIKHYELDIAAYAGTYVNATEGGAKLLGAKLMTLAEAIDTYLGESFAPGKLVREMLQYPPDDNKIRDAVTILDQVRVTQKFIQQTIDKCTRALKVIDKLEAKIVKRIRSRGGEGYVSVSDVSSAEAVAETLGKVLRMKEEIINKDKMFYLFLMHYIQSFLFQTDIDAIAAPEKFDLPLEQNFYVIQVQKTFFKVLIGLIQIIRQALDRTGANLDSWLAELRGEEMKGQAPAKSVGARKK